MNKENSTCLSQTGAGLVSRGGGGGVGVCLEELEDAACRVDEGVDVELSDILNI